MNANKGPAEVWLSLAVPGFSLCGKASGSEEEEEGEACYKGCPL